MKTTPNGQGGWASTKPGKTKYHHYHANGNSLKSECNYERKPGPLYYQMDPVASERCSACDLHLFKAKHPEKFNNHPSIPIERQSAWQKKQYGLKEIAPDVLPPKVVDDAPNNQLDLFS